MKENNRKIFERLAESAGIRIKFGWIGNLEKELNLSRGDISRWIHRGISSDGISAIEQRGYPREMWLKDDEYQQFAGDKPARDLILTPEEKDLIEAIRVLDYESRTGLYSVTITQLNLARKEKEIVKNTNKRHILDRAISTLGKAISKL